MVKDVSGLPHGYNTSEAKKVQGKGSRNRKLYYVIFLKFFILVLAKAVMFSDVKLHMFSLV